MRLRFPLQGIILVANLHPILHLSMLIGNILREPGMIPAYYETFIPESEYIGADKSIRNVCHYMLFGHATILVINIIAAYLGTKDKFMHAVTLNIIGSVVFYITPILLMVYYLNKYYPLITHFDTPYSDWLFIEVQMFVCWIIASTLFLLIVYNGQYRSNWQEVSIKVHRSIWREKDTDDFLHYVRHEYIVFCLSVCPAIFDYSMIYFIWDP